MKKLSGIIFLFVLASPAFAQYIDESLLFSRSQVFGTARTAGAGGAFGSVGADLGSIDINPAGLGLYRTSDFSITPALRFNNNETDFKGSNSHIKSSQFNLGQVGVEWTRLLKNATRSSEINFRKQLLRSLTFAINYQRQSLFIRKQNFDATETGISMINTYADYVNQVQLPVVYPNYSLELLLANRHGLIRRNGSTGPYTGIVNVPVYQFGNVETRGGVNKLDFAFGGNMNDKVYFGIGVGIPFLNYNITTVFSEQNINPDPTRFYQYDLDSRLVVSGTGVTGSAGLLFRPVSWLRFGAAYHLPTWYRVTESYTTNMVAFYDTINYGELMTEGLDARYRFRTPMKGVISASFFFKQRGFFSVDYELQNPGTSRYNFGNGGQEASRLVNEAIKSAYLLQHTVRAGTEFAYKALRLRTGYSFSSSPYKRSMAPPGYAAARHTITAGIGLRLKSFYADFAYLYGISKDAGYIYDAGALNNRLATHSFMLTLGWKVNRNTSAADSPY